MWANSVWGLVGLAVTFGVAALGLTPEQAWLRPWLTDSSIVSAVASVAILCWPLHRRDNRAKVRDALNHPVRWIVQIVEPFTS